MPQACPIRRALLSVWDKTGLVDFARALSTEFGVELISTGGTAAALTAAGLPVTLVEQVTGFPELLDGRVKTLHPHIHAALLADRDNRTHMLQLAAHKIAPIDLVVVNLYPFERTAARPDCTLAEAVEMIDIGGPTLLRAAAKNYRHVFVLPDQSYWQVLIHMLLGARQQGWGSLAHEEFEAFRRNMAAIVFERISRYDAGIAAWLSAGDFHSIHLRRWHTLRYGENPGQDAWVGVPSDPAAVGRPCLPGNDPMLQAGAQTELSFNNYADADAALGLCGELTRASPGVPAVCFIKHTNACGAAMVDPYPDAEPGSGGALRGAALEAYRRAYLGDPNAAMGGILAVNFPVDADFAAAVMETYGRLGKPLKNAGAPYAPGGFFVEVWLAPSFRSEAVDVIRGRAADRPQKDWGQRVRLLAVGDLAIPPDAATLDYKRIAGGMLVQTRDSVALAAEPWQVVTKKAPDGNELRDARLAWLICKHTKSNSITICRDGMLLGNGAGQMSRVMSCRIATWLARENGHAGRLDGAIAASDAYFPFADGPQVLIDAGIRTLVQPGGSKRDAEVIAACDAAGVAMVLTGTRHFRH